MNCSNKTILTVTFNPAVDVSTQAPEIADTLKIRCENAVYGPGGGGVNVARIIHRFGGNTIAHIAAGGGVGHLLETLLGEEGVTCCLHEIAAMTRQNFAITEIPTQRQFRFVLPGAEMSPRETGLLIERLFSFAELPGAMVASGSLPPGVPTDIYAHIARRSTEAGVFFALDTSGPPLEKALTAPFGLLKVNEREITELLGSNWRREGPALVAKGALKMLVVTRGPDGAILYSADRTIETASPSVDVVSAVGAGDSFMGAMVLALCRGWSQEKALNYALATGAAAALTPATDLARPRDVERLFGDMTGG